MHDWKTGKNLVGRAILPRPSRLGGGWGLVAHDAVLWWLGFGSSFAQLPATDLHPLVKSCRVVGMRQGTELPDCPAPARTLQREDKRTCVERKAVEIIYLQILLKFKSSLEASARPFNCSSKVYNIQQLTPRQCQGGTSRNPHHPYELAEARPGHWQTQERGEDAPVASSM